ncbi:MAG: DUF6065 family protein [Allosphingosinicella sp.]|uniref:DUF6065 family protein n=1 Tax=Allosphingosinicella sp. TaxID=2823234 RepID=UPI003923C54D
MDLICYTYPGWNPRLRPAPQKRDWMDATPESFAYRCLPLAIANAHGWEVLSPCGFEARWLGGQDSSEVEVRLDEGTDPREAAVSLFGQGTITFHVSGIFRTPPGWNLFVGPVPNHAKDGIFPLTGVIETDWSPYSFTMNWRFTRPNHWVRFEQNEPIAFIFPVERGRVEGVVPRLRPIEEEPGLREQFEAWSASRNAFQEHVQKNPPSKPSEKWQKLYYRGKRPDGSDGAPDHQSKLRVPPFVGADGKPLSFPEARSCPMAHAAAAEPPPAAAPAEAPAQASPAPVDDLQLRRRDWMLDVGERQRLLAEPEEGIRRVGGLSGDDFLDLFYAPMRPVVITGEMADWPALRLFNPDYLRRKVGSAEVEYQGGRSNDPNFERAKDDHKQRLPFDRYMDLIDGAGWTNDAYITAYNSGTNREALAPLMEDLGYLEKYLTREHGMMWIGPMGTFTPLHHDLTNNLLAQVTGSKRIVLVPPSESSRLYNRTHVFSDIHDITDPDQLEQFSLAKDARTYDVDLEQGELLYIPLGWWHQVTALDFSVTLTYTNFRWPNVGHDRFPAA